MRQSSCARRRLETFGDGSRLAPVGSPGRREVTVDGAKVYYVAGNRVFWSSCLPNGTVLRVTSSCDGVTATTRSCVSKNAVVETADSGSGHVRSPAASAPGEREVRHGGRRRSIHLARSARHRRGMSRRAHRRAWMTPVAVSICAYGAVEVRAVRLRPGTFRAPAASTQRRVGKIGHIYRHFPLHFPPHFPPFPPSSRGENFPLSRSYPARQVAAAAADFTSKLPSLTTTRSRVREIFSRTAV